MDLRAIPVGLTFLILCQAFACSMAQQSEAAVTPVAAADEACARCHEAIFHQYLNTPMANASGRAWDHAIPGNFYHAPSRTTYRVYAEDDSLWPSYARTRNSGRQKLGYFLGSGHLGMIYLYTIHGYLLETPVDYYANSKAYDMKPGLGYSTGMPAALPMSPGCMRCHMSGVQRAERGNRNPYQESPFCKEALLARAATVTRKSTSAPLAERG
jgi:hypothetical protein